MSELMESALAGLWETHHRFFPEVRPLPSPQNVGFEVSGSPGTLHSLFLALLLLSQGRTKDACLCVEEEVERESQGGCLGMLLRYVGAHLREVCEANEAEQDTRYHGSAEGFRFATHFIFILHNHTFFQRVFIEGGGNVPLYSSVTHGLSSVYENMQESTDVVTLLDIGPGNGMALLPSLLHNHCKLFAVTLVEPCEDMLTSCKNDLEKNGVPVRCHNAAIEDFIGRESESVHFRLIQSTFCLHNLTPSARQRVFEWIYRHCDEFVLVEFDVVGEVSYTSELSSQLSPVRFLRILKKYLMGIAEYENIPTCEVVVKSFLVPAFLGAFGDAKRANYEQSCERWAGELRSAGFQTNVSVLYPYWWADAFLLHCRKA